MLKKFERCAAGARSTARSLTPNSVPSDQRTTDWPRKPAHSGPAGRQSGSSSCRQATPGERESATPRGTYRPPAHALPFPRRGRSRDIGPDIVSAGGHSESALWSFLPSWAACAGRPGLAPSSCHRWASQAADCATSRAIASTPTNSTILIMRRSSVRPVAASPKSRRGRCGHQTTEWLPPWRGTTTGWDGLRKNQISNEKPNGPGGMGRQYTGQFRRSHAEMPGQDIAEKIAELAAHS